MTTKSLQKIDKKRFWIQWYIELPLNLCIEQISKFGFKCQMHIFKVNCGNSLIMQWGILYGSPYPPSHRKKRYATRDKPISLPSQEVVPDIITITRGINQTSKYFLTPIKWSSSRRATSIQKKRHPTSAVYFQVAVLPSVDQVLLHDSGGLLSSVRFNTSHCGDPSNLPHAL